MLSGRCDSRPPLTPRAGLAPWADKRSILRQVIFIHCLDFKYVLSHDTRNDWLVPETNTAYMVKLGWRFFKNALLGRGARCRLFSKQITKGPHLSLTVGLISLLSIGGGFGTWNATGRPFGRSRFPYFLILPQLVVKAGIQIKQGWRFVLACWWRSPPLIWGARK